MGEALLNTSYEVAPRPFSGTLITINAGEAKALCETKVMVIGPARAGRVFNRQ